MNVSIESFPGENASTAEKVSFHSELVAEMKMRLFGMQCDRARAAKDQNPTPTVVAQIENLDKEILMHTDMLTAIRLKMAYWRAKDAGNYDLARQKKHQLDEYEKNKNNIVVTTVGWECKVVFSYPSHPATLATLHQDLAISRITEDRINADLDLAGKHDPKDTQQMQKLDAELQRAVMEARRIKGRIAYHGALDANDFTLARKYERKLNELSKKTVSAVVAANARYKDSQTTGDAGQPKPARVRFDV